MIMHDSPPGSINVDHLLWTNQVQSVAEYSGTKREKRKDIRSQRKDNESVNTMSILAGQNLCNHDYSMRHTFSGATSEVWAEFIKY